MAWKRQSVCLKVVLSALVTIFMSQVENCMAQQQYLKLFTHSSTCDEIGFNSTITFRNTTVNHSTGNVSSFEVYGMWKIGVCPSQVPCYDFLFNTSFPTYIANDPGCVPKVFNSTPGTGTIKWTLNLVRLGDEYQNSGALYLYPAKDFNDTVTTIYQRGRNFTSAMSVQSYFFTGNHRWTLFEGPNYTGKKTCLRPSAEIARRGYGFNAVEDANFTVRSVRYTCSACNNTPYWLSLLTLSVFTFYLTTTSS